MVQTLNIMVLMRDREPEDARIIEVKIRVAGMDWSVLAVYGPQVGTNWREDCWKRLAEEIKQRRNELCLVMGDFNAIQHNVEALNLDRAAELVVPGTGWSWNGCLEMAWQEHGDGEDDLGASRCCKGMKN